TGATTQAIQYCVSEPGEYTVHVTVFEGLCALGTDTLTITANQAGELQFEIFDWRGKRYSRADIEMHVLAGSAASSGLAPAVKAKVPTTCGDCNCSTSGIYDAGLFRLYFMDMLQPHLNNSNTLIGTNKGFDQ